ncbi:MAG: phospholipase D family protein [bacterium]|nr:phospholipase D family protein [bacterium]
MLKQLCQSAINELWLVAPFIKVATLQRLLDGVSPHVIIHCVTRWRPEEIASGVSDIAVWDVLKGRGNSQLWLCPNLHAKYYRGDDHCLIGSANLTATALGWSSHPNLELLVDMNPQHPSLAGFESILLATSIPVTDALYEQTKSLVDLIQHEKIILLTSPDALIQPEEGGGYEAWIPHLRNPESLFLAYADKRDNLTDAVYADAMSDLSALNIPQGMSKPAFESYVGYALSQMPIIRQIDAFVGQPRRFGEMVAHLKRLPCADTPYFDTKSAWQTVMRWLLHFLPTHYRCWVDSRTEMFSK